MKSQSVGLLGVLVLVSATGCESWLQTSPASAQATIVKRGARILYDGTIVIFDNSAVTDDDLIHLQHIPKLTGLSLVNTGITDAGLAHLVDHPQLEDLNLDRTKITDAGMKHVQGIPKLRTLTLAGTQVTDSGVDEFQSARPDCKINRKP